MTPQIDSVSTMRRAHARALANGKIGQAEYDRRMSDLAARRAFEIRMGIAAAEEEGRS